MVVKHGYEWRLQDEAVWTEDDQPLTFTTKAEALTAMRDYLRECERAGLEVNRADFELVKIVITEHTLQ
jgi:hypothetical protein